MTLRAFSFNGTDMGGSTYGLAVISGDAPSMPQPRLNRQKLASADGEVIQGSTYDAKEFVLKCRVIGTSEGDRESKISAIISKLQDSQSDEVSFYLDRTPGDIYQVRFAGGLENVEGAIAGEEFELRFIAPDPWPT